ILALDDTYYGAIRAVANWVISNLGYLWKPYQILGNTISWQRSEIAGDDSRLGLPHRTHDGPPIQFEVATENANEFLHYPGPRRGCCMRLRDLEGKSVLMACEIERSVRSFLAE